MNITYKNKFTLMTAKGHPTDKGRLLIDSTNRGGIAPSGKSSWARTGEYNSLEQLVKFGLVEKRNTGPRGGIRYHATRKGRYWVKKMILDQSI